uniref:Uncharacterized protein n=1 Tax=Anguilla anguilla TaxID=7936 RepID=A0A0E9T7P8_ANGAN
MDAVSEPPDPEIRLVRRDLVERVGVAKDGDPI